MIKRNDNGKIEEFTLSIPLPPLKRDEWGMIALLVAFMIMVMSILSCYTANQTHKKQIEGINKQIDKVKEAVNKRNVADEINVIGNRSEKNTGRVAALSDEVATIKKQLQGLIK